MANSFLNQEKLSDGVGVHITRAIYKAIEKDQTENVNELVGFVGNMLFKSYKTNLKTFEQFIGVPSYFYFKGYITGKYPNLSLDAAQLLTDLIRFSGILELEKSSSFLELQNVNSFVYLTFRGYSQLFYQIIVNKDFRSFEKVIDKYRIAFTFNRLDYPSFLHRENLPLYEFENKYYTEIQEFRKLSDYHRRVKFAVLSWLYFLYDNCQIGKDELLQFVKLISFENLNSNDLIKDLIFYNSYNFDLFDWNRWDYLERKEFVVYSPPQPADWLTFGFALYSLKQFNLSDIDYNKLENIELLKWLPDKLDKCFKKILNENEKWNDIQWPEKEHSPDIKLLESNILKILDPFYRLKRRYERTIDKIILGQDLSIARINSFKNAIYEIFNKASTIREAFINYKNIELVKEITDINKDVLCINTNFGRARMMFVEEKNQFIFGTQDWGGIVAREIDDRFIKKIEKIKSQNTWDNILKAISENMDRLKQKEFNPNLIIIDSHLTYSSFGLTRDSEFIPSWNSNGKKESIFDLGYYKGIPVKSIFSKGWKNKILICDFAKAFKAQELNNDELYENSLKIIVESISDEQAYEMFKNNPEAWQKNEDGLVLSEEEAIEIIKLNVHIEICYEILFEFKDTNAFELILIKE